MSTLGRHRLSAAALGCTAVLAALGAGPASAAAAVASTGGATSITSTSAVLNGVSTGSVDSSWTFQYGKTTTYDHLKPNPPSVIGQGNGVLALAATVTGLTPSTTYHFRLVVCQACSDSEPSYFVGADRTFKTLATGPPASSYGTASLLSHRFHVIKGAAFVTFRCSGVAGAKCTGKVSMSARGKFGKHYKTVSCGTATLQATARSQRTLRAGVPRGCRSLMAKSRGQLGAKLLATFSTHQRPLKASVTLLG